MVLEDHLHCPSLPVGPRGGLRRYPRTKFGRPLEESRRGRKYGDEVVVSCNV